MVSKQIEKELEEAIEEEASEEPIEKGAPDLEKSYLWLLMAFAFFSGIVVGFVLGKWIV